MDLDQFLSKARDRFDFGRTADAEDRTAGEDDNAFANADNKDLGQWEAVAKKARKKRPVLQWNRIPIYVQQVVNDGRLNKPGIRVSQGDGGTQETAEYYQGRIRHIEYESNADTARDTSRDQQVTSGRGFMRVSTEYVPGTFNQRIRVDRIENQFSVVFDPAAVEYTRQDADWAFIISQISKDAHKRKYGEESLVNRLDFAEAMRLAPDWIGIGSDQEMIQIAEYFVKEFRDRQLLLLATEGRDPLPVWRDQLSDEQYETFKRNGNIRAERTDQVPTVWQYVINGAEILSKNQWIGSTIPIIPVWGREATVAGKRRTFSLVRNARDPQKLVNLYVSNIAELLGQMPKSPYLVPMGGIPAASESDWQNALNTALAWLPFEVYDAAGRPIPKPERITNEPPIQALSIGLNQAIDGIKAAMGIYDASLGAKSNEQSGVAIERRRKQANITNYHFPDNEARSNKYLGEILVELIPLIDKPGTTNPIRTEDGKTHLVPVGTQHRDWKTGEEVIHDLRSGQYGVTVSQGPSYESARQEVLERDQALIQAWPELMMVIGDQFFGADDSAGSQERSERMRRFIMAKNPGIIVDPKQGQPLPPQVQQQIVGLQQENQRLHAFAQTLHEQIATKQPELELKSKELDLQARELELKKYTVDQQEETKRTLGLTTADQMAGIALLKEEIGALKSQHSQLHEQFTQERDHAHALEKQKAQQEHTSALATQQQQATADSKAAEHAHELELQQREAEAAQAQIEAQPEPQAQEAT